ncbi:MAG: hypothetical protein V7K21_21505 [Nostoc sp.]|uniref:hypothetical protein n=1 Tax=Nostoc sp. TaxID=1180 RepID=UPI002FFBB489
MGDLGSPNHGSSLSYFDPAFNDHIAEIFVRYAADDPTLAADIASRQNTVEGLDIINEAVQKRYSFILRRDFICLTNPIALDHMRRQAEWGEKLSESNLVSLLNKKFGLPCKGLVLSVPLHQGTFDLLENFLKEKYPGIYQSAYTVFEPLSKQYSYSSLKYEVVSKQNSYSSMEDDIALFSYFILEINDWVRDQGGSYM